MNGNFISFTQAAAMTALFRANKESILGTQYQNKGILYVCETFDRSLFDDILAQDGAAGLRFYNGMDENLETRLIAVAVDKDGHDMVSAASGSTKAAPGGLITEEGQRCPTNCPPPPPSGL